MDKVQTKFSVTNCREDGLPLTVWVEPLALDYTLLIGESLDLVVTWHSSFPWFSTNVAGQDWAVYLEGQTEFVILQNGNALQYGHNRSARPELSRDENSQK